MRFEIYPKSVYSRHNEGFDENSISTSRIKRLLLAAISPKIQENGINERELCTSGMMYFKNWPTFQDCFSLAEKSSE